MAKTRKKKTEVIIQNFGLFWKRKYINWEQRQLIGKATNEKSSGDAVNFWGQKGIYVLYKEFEPIYVGQVGLKKDGRNQLGFRLGSHKNSIDMGEKWDTFSWFGVMPVSTKKAPKSFHKKYEFNKSDEATQYANPRALLDAKQSKVTPEGLVTLLEAVVISLFGGSIQNKQEGAWRNLDIKRFHQDQNSDPALYALRQNDPLDAGVLATIEKSVHSLHDALERLQEKDEDLEVEILGTGKKEAQQISRIRSGLRIKEKGKANSQLFRELSTIKKKMPRKTKRRK